MEGSRDSSRAPERSVDELVEIFETTDMGDLIREMPEVEAEIDLQQSRHLVELEDDVVQRLTETARDRKVSTRSLVNALLREKLSEAS